MKAICRETWHCLALSWLSRTSAVNGESTGVSRRFARRRGVELFDMTCSLLLGKFRRPGFSGTDTLCSTCYRLGIDVRCQGNHFTLNHETLIGFFIGPITPARSVFQAEAVKNRNVSAAVADELL